LANQNSAAKHIAAVVNSSDTSGNYFFSQPGDAHFKRGCGGELITAQVSVDLLVVRIG
jgi:hypothetical protein